MTSPAINTVNILISIHPQYASKIIEGTKTIELRRKFPLLPEGGRLFIYSTSPVKAIIGIAEIKKVHCLKLKELSKKFKGLAHVSTQDFESYFFNLEEGFAIELRNPIQFVTPISLDVLRNKFSITPPQSYRYLDEEFLKFYGRSKRKNIYSS